MKFSKLQHIKSTKLTLVLCLSIFGLFCSLIFIQSQIVHSQNENYFRVGERLTYNISFEQFNNAAFAEFAIVSRGKLEGIDSVELHSKLKSVDLLSAAFYMFDEERTTFASVETGLPLYVKKVSNAGITPQTKILNYLKSPTINYDLLTLLQRIRYSNGIGTFLFQEDGKDYSLTIQSTGVEQLKTVVGIVETTKIIVQSPYLTELGIINLSVNITSDEQKIPVLMRLNTKKGEFRVEIASRQVLNETIDPNAIPISTPTLIPTQTPTPVPTPLPYVVNQPLIERLPFVLGETLEFKISKQQQDAGTVLLKVEERKEVLGKDSLLLKAIAVNRGALPVPVFDVNNQITSQVDPVSLMPTLSELKLSNALAEFSQIIKFDQEKGTVIYDGNNVQEIPVGTHSILSLAYAIRSFNLKPSLDKDNPVNDTRVAVFLGTEPYVFTLRPSNSEIINLKGEKISAQLITIRSGNPNIDKYNIKLWLGLENNRLPLRLTAGDYQADLVSYRIIPPNR